MVNHFNQIQSQLLPFNFLKLIWLRCVKNINGKNIFTFLSIDINEVITDVEFVAVPSRSRMKFYESSLLKSPLLELASEVRSRKWTKSCIACTVMYQSEYKARVEIFGVRKKEKKERFRQDSQG